MTAHCWQPRLLTSLTWNNLVVEADRGKAADSKADLSGDHGTQRQGEASGDHGIPPVKNGNGGDVGSMGDGDDDEFAAWSEGALLSCTCAASAMGVLILLQRMFNVAVLFRCIQLGQTARPGVLGSTKVDNAMVAAGARPQLFSIPHFAATPAVVYVVCSCK